MTPNRNNMRNWKGIQAGYEPILITPASTEENLYCLQDNEVELILAAISPYHWNTRWYSIPDATIDKSLIEQFVSNLERKLMMSCCCNDQTSDGSPPLTRYIITDNDYWEYQISDKIS